MKTAKHRHVEAYARMWPREVFDHVDPASRADGYDGTMSLETHYRRPDGNEVESTRESLKGLLKVNKEI